MVVALIMMLAFDGCGLTTENRAASGSTSTTSAILGVDSCMVSMVRMVWVWSTLTRWCRRLAGF